MDGVQIEQMAGRQGTVTISNGNGETEEVVASTMNGQLEIEIPAGGERHGAFHTIQLQSPGGSSHIVEGLVVTTAGGGANGNEEGETVFHPTQAGTFILPTTSSHDHHHHHHHHHHNHHLATSSQTPTIVTTASPSCEVITADHADHHILSGLQVVRVTTGENGETIFLVPSSATSSDKHGEMQQVMVLQSAEDMGDETTATEMVEEAVEINIPSPKPVLTTVKQEIGANSNSSHDDEVVRHYQHQHQHQHQPTTLVVVRGPGSGSHSNVPTQQALLSDQKPMISSLNGHVSVTGTPVPVVTPVITHVNTSIMTPVITQVNTPVITTANGRAPEHRPKRKAALKAATTRQAGGVANAASAKKQLQQQQQSSHRTPKQSKSAKVEVTMMPSKYSPKQQQHPQSSLSIVSTTSHARMPPANAPPPPLILPPPPPLHIPASTSRFPPPPPPVITQRVMVQGTATVAGVQRNFYLLPEDVVSDSDTDDISTPVRKCIICLRRKRFTEDIYDNPTVGRPSLLPHMDVLISHLNVPAKGRPNEVGICPSCLNQLQRWHVFNCAIVKRHETVKASGISYDDSPVNHEPFETRVYRNYKKMAKVREVYLSATHTYLTRRQITEKDWDFFCDRLFHFNSLRSERARELEKYITCREKLSHFYCNKCQRLVKNGKKGFINHMKSQHPHDPVLFPCDICGGHFPERGNGAAIDDYYPHWISHFYFNSCDECGKRFPTKRSLGQHRHTVHKHRAQWNVKSPVERPGGSNEDRPWKCDHCDATFKMKGALVSHRDVVHFNLKNHVCGICGEAFKSASSLRGHVRRHEGRRDYKCEVCQKEYYTYSALKGHKVVHQTARDFVCGICNKAFKKKKALEEHGTLHTGVKPHRCPICGREIRVKSNLYKHMKIHKKNAELGITSGRGRTSTASSSPSPSSSSFSMGGGNSSSMPSTPTMPTVVSTTSLNTLAGVCNATPPIPRITSVVTANKAVKIKTEPGTRPIKIEMPDTEIKQEPGTSTQIQFQSSRPQGGNGSSSSPIQGATAVDVVLENDINSEGSARGPIVVSIVTDGVNGGPCNLLEMDPEQQTHIISAVTSLANSQGQAVTVATPNSNTPTNGTVYITSPQQPASSTTTTSAGGAPPTGTDPILGVSSSQFYSTQQFFTSLDQLQN